MPRRQFIADLDKAQKDVLPLGVIDVKAGEDDGQLELLFTGGSNGLASGPVKITAIVSDLGDYPQSHQYMLFGDDNAPRDLADALSRAADRSGRKTVFEVLDFISSTLTNISPDKDGDSQMHDSHQTDEEFGDEDEDDDDIYDSDHEAFEDAAPSHNPAYASRAPRTTTARASDQPFRERIRSDLRAAKDAGFKVGHLGHLLDGFNSYVTVSIRICKLGISEEAMQAWQVLPSDYLILIIQYPNGYKTNEELQGFDSIRLAPNIGMRVVAGKRYKPTLQEAIKAFTVVRREDRNSIASNELPGPDEEESSIRDTFISKPLVSLLQERLVPILRYRGAGLGWMGAEDFYRNQISVALGAGNADVVDDKYFLEEAVNDALPSIVNEDHYQSKATLFSFPLLAMQFLLRHFVRCTEFCLVCHKKLNSEVEAIKPYICDDGLCLYQYMSLGFGPSIEHELLAQPYVVDLLVSFCYNSCSSRKIKDFPKGLSLVVPPVDPSAWNVMDPVAGYGRGILPLANAPTTKKKQKQDENSGQTFEVGFDRSKLELIFHDKSVPCPLRRGNWIILKTAVKGTDDMHCRVSETTFYPTVSIDPPVSIRPQLDTPYGPTPGNGTSTPAATRPVSPASTTPNYVPASFQIYDQDFDHLDKNGMCLSLCRLLDTLPDVTQMREYLLKHHPSELKNWIERISPSALTVLRWIIASNRACIMQVDGNEVQDGKTDKANKGSKSVSPAYGKTQERCHGMKDYMQFRFAMGAPDKEQRFINEVRNTTERLNLQYPTLFAWHGSPLHNWHMIIREGLHYKQADHGRAYGDGVYHAPAVQTSLGYSGMYGGVRTAGGNAQGQWPGSVLCVNTAVALNEIVNAPAEYQSQTPHYVVKQLDWIQTRYLFVQVSPISDSIQVGIEKQPLKPHPQDPKRTPQGLVGALSIPASAIKSSKIFRHAASKEKKRSFSAMQGSSSSNPVVLDDDDEGSVCTDTEDLEILFPEAKSPEPVPPASSQTTPLASKKEIKGPTTDFEPGTLDFSTLPIMPTPTYATGGTSKRLMGELKTLLKIQESSNLAELGWFIDFDKIDNVYQWIVELHSFHILEDKGKPLPLAEDMKKQGVKSVVLEIRFNKDFPFTPPYVRVVRPRFLSLAQGGGGHIVIGGAMCMELLTNTGWSAISSMESVLMQIRLAIASEPFARLEKSGRSIDYGTGEAADGYMRACATHGWEVPPGFKEMAYGGQGGSSRFPGY